MKRATLALYGNVAIPRFWCAACRRDALVLRGVLQCCDTPVTQAPTIVKRMAEPEFRRRTPAPVEQVAILTAQDNRCLYCLLPFGMRVYRGTRATRLRLEWDHVVPFAYAQDNHARNVVAACHVCNGIKGDHMWPTLDDARAAIATVREAKGYTTTPPTLVRRVG